MSFYLYILKNSWSIFEYFKLFWIFKILIFERACYRLLTQWKYCDFRSIMGKMVCKENSLILIRGLNLNEIVILVQINKNIFFDSPQNGIWVNEYYILVRRWIQINGNN